MHSISQLYAAHVPRSQSSAVVLLTDDIDITRIRVRVHTDARPERRVSKYTYKIKHPVAPSPQAKSKSKSSIPSPS